MTYFTLPERERSSASANECSSGEAFGLLAAFATFGGNGVLHSPGKVSTMIGAKAPGTAADAATALAIGYSARSLHMAAKVTGANKNGVRL